MTVTGHCRFARGATAAKPAVGLDAVRQVFEGNDLSRAWSTIQVVLEELRESGTGVIALGTLHRRGRYSNLSFDRPFATVFDLRDGKITRIETFESHQEALEAAGPRD
jgi:ketosteroid isomerase-like protein